jgi:hydrogenase maturation protease
VRVLVAGVGNVFLGDDGFGVEVARRLAGAALPDGAEVADYGIRGLHLAYRLLDGVDLLVMVDAMARGQEPGTIYVLEPDPDAPAPEALDAHGLDPATVLAMVRQLGGSPVRTIVVGCEPASLEEGIGLSPAVERAVTEAVEVVRRVIGGA